MSELKGIMAGAVLMLGGIVAGFCLNEVARHGLPQPRPRERKPLALPPPVPHEPLTQDFPSFRPPPAAEELMAPPTPRDMQASNSFYEVQEKLRLQAHYGDSAGMLTQF